MIKITNVVDDVIKHGESLMTPLSPAEVKSHVIIRFKNILSWIKNTTEVDVSCM